VHILENFGTRTPKGYVYPWLKTTAIELSYSWDLTWTIQWLHCHVWLYMPYAPVTKISVSVQIPVFLAARYR